MLAQACPGAIACMSYRLTCVFTPVPSCRIWTPKFWTSRSLVNFNFTGFLDYESGIQRYQWGIGSKPNTADVVPLINVTSGRVLKDIRYTGGTQKMFVTPVVSLHMKHGRAAAAKMEHSVAQPGCPCMQPAQHGKA